MRRTLILDEDDLVMVVKEDVVKQIDENRGEMNRTEFVTHLIQCQLKDFHDQQEYVTQEALRQFTQEVKELLHNFLQFFVSYGMALGRRPQDEEFQALSRQLDSLEKMESPDSPDEETEAL